MFIYIRSSFNLIFFYRGYILKNICLMIVFCFDRRFREEEVFKTILFREDRTENETKTEKNWII